MIWHRVTFPYAIEQLKNVFHPTPEELDRLREAAKEMGDTTVFSATEAAICLKLLGHAAFDVDQAVAALPTTLDLSAFTQVSFEDAIKEIAAGRKKFS